MHYTLKRSWVEVDTEKLVSNLITCKSILPSKSEIMAVVKADAYGHGDVIVAKKLEEAGVNLFAVSNLNEAILLRESNIHGEIVILGYTPVDMAELLCDYNITQTIISEEYAQKLYKSTSRKIKCQIAVDTGMNRIGISTDNITNCIDWIHKCTKMFNVNGIFTHLSVADSEIVTDIEFTQKQILKFQDVVTGIRKLNLQYIHCLNSAGALYYKDFIGCDNPIVRLGIILYGLSPNINNKIPDNLSPILTWKTVVSMVKKVKKGDFIGYGRSYKVPDEILVATLPTGYADGYSRFNSNKGYVLIKGEKAPIVGKICMDQMMVDVTNIPDVSLGDEVILIGKSGKEQITTDDMAAMIGTIGYEIVCNISKRVERVYI